MKPCIKFILRGLAGLAAQHEKTQVMLTKFLFIGKI